MGGFELSKEMRDSLDHIEAPGLRALMAHWRDCLRGGEELPTKARIDPLALGPIGILPSVWIVEVPKDGPPFYRLAGEKIGQGFGHSVMKQSIYAVFEEPVAAAIERRWRMLLANLLMSHTIGEISTEEGVTYVGERVALPLADDTGDRRFIIGCTQAQPPRHIAKDKALKTYKELQSTLMPLSLVRAMA